jgi:hypothetical protein
MILDSKYIASNISQCEGEILTSMFQDSDITTFSLSQDGVSVDMDMSQDGDINVDVTTCSEVAVGQFDEQQFSSAFNI